MGVIEHVDAVKLVMVCMQKGEETEREDEKDHSDSSSLIYTESAGRAKEMEKEK
jgi:hypothetical protein